MYDILIIGGGINGCAIARDAAGRGLKVLLVEQNDLASATSSASTKLIHGGLRYLENYEFRLVREALIEREILLKSAPHIIWPLTFVLPHANHLRPKWMIKLGLWFYDHLAPRKKLPASKSVNLKENELGAPLKDTYDTGFTYADCWVDDARLVVLNALDAMQHGATIKTHTKLTSAKRFSDHWEATLSNDEIVHAKVIVNSAGPWITEVLTNSLNINTDKKVKLVKGSHIVVNRLYSGDHAYILQNRDKRIAFAIPYEDKFTLIGTTDVPYTDEPESVNISDTEVDYLIDLINQFWKDPISRSDIVWSYSGVRPLYDSGESNASVVTRDYVFDLNKELAPVLTIFGGKITTSRRLAEHALQELKIVLPIHNPAWTDFAYLPGSDVTFSVLLNRLIINKPFLSFNDASRLARTYGTKVYDILGDAVCMEELGQNFGHGLTEAEVRYLIKNEWATCVEDILWRRTKLGLHLTDVEQQNLAVYIQQL